LLQGRDFNETDGTSNHEAAILTRDAANRLWPDENPIGRRFRLFDDKNVPGGWIEVIGISANVVQELQENEPKPLLFIPYRQKGWGNMALVVESSADPLQSMRKAVQSLDGELPLSEPLRLNDAIEHRVWFLRVFGKVFLAFAFIAMLMASVGIYAVVSHATSSRTQEIGVRIALGATMRSILLLVMRRGLWQIAVGLALGCAAAFPLGRVMAAMPNGGLRSDPNVIAILAATLAAVGVFACWLPAHRATSLDPVKAIRYE
jgi:ABC-type antimicrobial peptide transport system permease subunit